VLEAGGGAPVDAAVILSWRAAVLRACAALGWPAPVLDARVHPGGATLAFSAAADQLYTATEVNEWAWQWASEHRDGFHAPGFPAAWDEDSALQTLRLLAAEERNPRLIDLIDAARAHGLPIYADDDTVSIGEGRGSRSCLTRALPTVDEVPWDELHAVPKALVTGSNGKTTTVRVLAAMLRAQGLRTGHSCTDGLFVDGKPMESGDFSGPSGARAILRHPDVQAAVLETARGGILRRGLGVSRADVAVVTNVSADHFGEYGIYSLDDLAQVKLAVARVLGPDGLLVLNADDPALVRHAAVLECPLAWFAQDHRHPLLAAHRAAGGMTCGAEDGELVLSRAAGRVALGRIDAMPLTVAGIASYNIANLAAAALAAVHLGLPIAIIADTLSRFGARRDDNVGRLQRWRLDGVEVLLDYAHNPEGLQGFLDIAGHERGGGRLGLLLGQAGNRSDEDVRQLAITAARHRPDRVVLKDIDGFMRGRAAGEIAELLRAQLLASGVDAASMSTVLDEASAARELICWARRGDVVALPVHASAARARVTDLLDQLEAGDWRAGDPLPQLPGFDRDA